MNWSRSNRNFAGYAFVAAMLASTLCGALAVRAGTASLLLNEMNPNLSGSHDLIELLAIEGGNIQGFRVEQISSTSVLLATLPAIEVAKGDLIVVHLTPSGTFGIAPVSETVAKSQYPYSMYAANFDGAWDVLGENVGATYGYRVVVVKEPGGAIQDAVPFYLVGGTATAAFPADLQQIQAQGLWYPTNCGGALCTYASTPDATAVSVNWTGMGTTVLGNSVQRKSVMDGNVNTDWVVQPSTFGFFNTNQAVLFIERVGNTVTVSYTAAPGFVLEQSTNLPANTWTAGPNGNPTAPIPVAGAARFFRLRKP